MNNDQDNNPLQNTNSVETGGQKFDHQPAVQPRAVVFVALAVAILLLVVVLAVLFAKNPVPQSLGVDKNGVPIINLNETQVVERVSDNKPLNEPEIHAVFRWAVEHPDEAARLSAEEKANIIRALNE